tara:strand:+ start:2423 stop:3061 length:639 start_codon:yes stop_codon:yes gene_type:complete
MNLDEKFVDAVYEGDWEYAEELLDMGADVNYCPAGRRPVYYAAKENKKELVRLFLSSGACYYEALLGAYDGNHTKLIYFIIENFTDLDVALLEASSHGNDKIAKLLIDKGAKLNIVDEDGKTPLFIASSSGHVEAAELFLNEGAEINCFNANGMTPLMGSSKNGRTETAKLLIRRGADLNACNNQKCTSLMLAIRNEDIEMIKLLVKAGAKI